jgi:hypothetical protein
MWCQTGAWYQGYRVHRLAGRWRITGWRPGTWRMSRSDFYEALGRRDQRAK